jgi:tetratricopeptide (TPR) repeat protein
MRCFTQLLITSAEEIAPLHTRTLLSFSLWQTKKGRRSGKHLEPQCGVGFLQRPENPRMQYGRSPRGSPHFGQLEQLSMNRGIMAYAELGQPDDARRCIEDAIEKVERSKERWCAAEVHRIAGEIALKSPAPDPEKAEAYFERALAVARQQQTKSWELRAAMSMSRLWRKQGKRDEARELLALVYGWFTEGFDTRDLKEAKALLDMLAS